METAQLQTNRAYSVIEMTDSVTALYGSDSDPLSDFEDFVENFIPRPESPVPSVSAFKGIGSWTENILDSTDYLRFQSQHVAPKISCEAEAVNRAINRTIGKKLLSTVFRCS